MIGASTKPIVAASFSPSGSRRGAGAAVAASGGAAGGATAAGGGGGGGGGGARAAPPSGGGGRRRRGRGRRLAARHREQQPGHEFKQPRGCIAAPVHRILLLAPGRLRRGERRPASLASPLGVLPYV